MSEATRKAALEIAVTHHMHHKSMAPADEVANTAEVFHAFITASDTPTDTPVKAVAAKPKAVTKPAASKATPAKAAPAKKTPAPQPDEEEAEEAPEETEASDGPTKEDVGNAIASLINSNLSKECGALLKKFGAKSLSGVAAEDYPAFMAEAEELLMNV